MVHNFFCVTEHYFLIFWPSEECCSEVIESKRVEPKDPAVRQTVKVKEEGKVFSGKVEVIGSKIEIESQLNEVENTTLLDGSNQWNLNKLVENSVYTALEKNLLFCCVAL